MEIHRNMCSISFSYVKLYLSQRKKGVSAISKSVRNQYLEFLAETGMTRYEFSKRSGIPKAHYGVWDRRKIMMCGKAIYEK